MKGWHLPSFLRAARDPLDRIVLSEADSNRLREIMSETEPPEAPRNPARLSIWLFVSFTAGSLVTVAILSARPDWLETIRSAASTALHSVLSLSGVGP